MIQDLGPDFRRKKGIVLYSGCSCTCCCCCIHTVVSGWFFACALDKAMAENSLSDLGDNARVGMVIAPLLAIGAFLMYALDSKIGLGPVGIAIWTVLLLGPIVFPVLAFASWLGGAIGITLGGGDRGKQMQALRNVFSHFVDAFARSVIWVLLVVAIICMFFVH